MIKDETEKKYIDLERKIADELYDMFTKHILNKLSSFMLQENMVQENLLDKKILIEINLNILLIFSKKLFSSCILSLSDCYEKYEEFANYFIKLQSEMFEEMLSTLLKMKDKKNLH